MEIGKFKLAKAYLVRPPKKPTSKFLTQEEAEAKSPGLFNAEVNENVVTKNYEAEEYINRVKSYVQSKYIDEDFARRLIEKKLKDLEMTQSDLDTSAINFATGGRVNRAIGGGAIEGEDLGTREGFADPDITYPFKTSGGKTDYRIGYNKKTDKYFRKVGKEDNIRTIVQEEGESLEDFKNRKPERVTTASDSTVQARQFIDNWTKNWFDENLKNFDVRNFDEMLNKLSNDWEIALESKDVPKGSASFKLTTPELKLPNITSGRDATTKKGTIKPFNYNNVTFYSNLEGNPTELGKTLSQYKKIFYKNQIENNPELRDGLNKFFDFMSSDKRGLYKKLDGKTIKQFMDTEVSDDVKFLLNAKASGLDKDSKFEVFNSYDDLADNYNTFTQDKARLKAVQIESEAMSKVGEKTKNQYLKVKESIKNQNDVLAKMSVEDIAKNKKLLNSVRMVINPISGEVSYTNYTVNDPKGKPALDDIELAKKIKQKASDGKFFVVEHISKKSLQKANTAYPNNIQSANYMSNVQLENARSFLSNSQNRVTEAAQNLDKALEQTGLTIRGPEYGGQRYGNKMDIIFDSNTGRSNIVDNQSIDIKGTRQSEIENLLNIEGVQKASEMPRSEFALQGEMFKNFNERLSKLTNTPTAEVAKDVSNVTKVINEMSNKMGSGMDPVLLAKYVKAEAQDLAEFGAKYGGNALGTVGKTLAGLDLPIMQVAFASMQDWEQDSPLWVTLPAAFTDEVANAFNLYQKTGGKAKEFGKFLASSFVPKTFLGKAVRSPLFKAVSKVGKVGSVATPLLEAGQEAYKFEKMKGMLPEIAKQFNIPIEVANKGFENYIRSTIPQDLAGQGFDETTVPESPGLPRLKRTFQDIGSIIGFGESPYKDPNAKEEIITPIAEPKTAPQQFLATGGRVGFADGPKDTKKGLGSLSKRNFLKTLALIPAGIMAIRGGPNLLKKAKPVVETFKKAPPHFIGLVNKIRALGKIIDPKKLLRSEQQRYSNVYDYGEYRMFERPDGQVEIQKQKLMATDYGDGIVSEEYMSYDPKRPKFNEKGEKIPGQYDEVYEENTTYADQYGEMQDVREGIEPETINDGTYSKEELEQLIIEQIEDSLKKGKK